MGSGWQERHEDVRDEDGQTETARKKVRKKGGGGRGCDEAPPRSRVGEKNGAANHAGRPAPQVGETLARWILRQARAPKALEVADEVRLDERNGARVSTMRGGLIWADGRPREARRCQPGESYIASTVVSHHAPSGTTSDGSL